MEGEFENKIHKEEYDGTDISEPGVIVIEVADVLKIVGEFRKEFWDLFNSDLVTTEYLKENKKLMVKWFGSVEK